MPDPWSAARCRRGALTSSGCHRSCEAEVEDLHLAIGEQEHIRGLEIAVRDAFAVRGGEPASDADGDLHGFAHGHRALRKRSASDSPSSSSVTTKSRSSSMPMSRRARILGCESAATARASRSKRARRSASSATSARQDLDGHVAPEPRVPRAIDFAHTAGAERRDDLVRAEACAGGQGHG